MGLRNALVIADVMHARQRPRQHIFNYHVYYLCFALSDMPKLAMRFLSLEKWNLFSFYRKDHGARDGSSLNDWIRGILDDYKITAADGEIVLLTLPRILGYVFNPVSFWFCFDKAGRLRAVLSEVANTFGERHSYISFHDDQRPIEKDEWLQAEKLFHVSPFLPVSGHYKFRFACDHSKVRVQVNYYDQDGLMLATSVGGKRTPLTSGNLIKAFFRYPLVTFKVVALIHVEAVRLLMKGARYYSKPNPPVTEVSQ